MCAILDAVCVRVVLCARSFFWCVCVCCLGRQTLGGFEGATKRKPTIAGVASSYSDTLTYPSRIP